MKQLNQKTIDLIETELASIPEKYASTNFYSTHEGLAVLREEYLELEQEVFWGEKKAKSDYPNSTLEIHKSRMRGEAVQVAAMAIRFIQELT